MGLRWSSPRVLGFGVSNRIGPSRNPSVNHGIGVVVMAGLVLMACVWAVKAMAHVWYVTVPVLMLLSALAASGKVVQRRETMPRSAPDKSRSQASVSNRR